MKVKELSPGVRKVDVIVRVVRKNKPRSVFVKRDGKSHQVADLLVGDETGTITLSLWDEMISQIQEDDVIQVVNGYVTEFGGKMQLNIGRFGQFQRLNASEYDFDVYLEEVETTSTGGAAHLIKVVDCMRQSRGINLIVRVVDQLPQRQVTTRSDGKSHIINIFVIGDETAVINFDLWDQGDDIAAGDVLEILGGYTREFSNVLSLNLSRAGSYKKVQEEVPEPDTARNLSEPSS